MAWKWLPVFVLVGCAAADATSELDSRAGAVGPVTTKRTRGSNSQIALPYNLSLGDVDGDFNADFIQTAGPRLFVSRTNFKRTGLSHRYVSQNITRTIVGDFLGQQRDQVCVVTSDARLGCFRSQGDELIQHLSQLNFISSSEDIIVGDFNGDRLDELMLYHRGTGAIRFAGGTSSFFILNHTSASGMQVTGMRWRAGDINGDGRDDLVAADVSGRLRFFPSVASGASTLFTVGASTNTGYVNGNHEISLARIDDDLTDDIYLRNVTTGNFDFYKAQVQSGALVAMTGVLDGQHPVRVGGAMVWTWNKATFTDPGSDTRDDTLFLDGATGGSVSTKARWNGASYTYYWDYDGALPRNHTGWPTAIDHGKWYIVKCKLSDVPVPSSADDARFLSWIGPGGVQSRYIRDVSYGTRDRSANVIDPVWHEVDILSTEIQPYTHDELQEACLDAADNPDTSAYSGVVTLFNHSEAGYQGYSGDVRLNTSNRLATMMHEMTHGEGFGHAQDDAGYEYGDYWDVMGVQYKWCGSDVSCPGPGLNGPHVDKYGWIPASRIYVPPTPSTTSRTVSVDLVPLDRPESNGYLYMKIGANTGDYYTVELRQPHLWDQHIPKEAVFLHRVNSATYLQTGGLGWTNAERTPMEPALDANGPVEPGGKLHVSMSVISIDATEHVARVSVTYQVKP